MASRSLVVERANVVRSPIAFFKTSESEEPKQRPARGDTAATESTAPASGMGNHHRSDVPNDRG